MSLVLPQAGVWTSKIGLHLFDVNVELTGTLIFLTKSVQTLNVGIATPTLALSSRAGKCLAVTLSHIPSLAQ